MRNPLLLLLAAAASPSHALQPLDPQAATALQAMRELNLIVLGDLHANGQEVEGRSFVGGNVTGSGTNWGIGNAGQGSAPSARPTLTVVGNMAQGNSQLNNGSNGGAGQVGQPAGITVGGNLSALNMNAQNATVRVGGSIANVNGSQGSSVQAGGGGSGNLNTNGGTITTNLGAAFTQPLVAGLLAERAALGQGLEALSARLGGYEWPGPNPSSLMFGGQGAVFNAATSSSGYALFTIDAARLGNEVRINASTAQPIIINVLGNSVNWNANFVNGNGLSARDLNPWIIWNFVEATSITFNRQVHGSVLAPFAHLNIGGVLEGSVVGRSATLSNEIHLGTFAGSDVILEEPVPEPGSWAMLIVGFGLVGAAARRQRRLSQPA